MSSLPPTASSLSSALAAVTRGFEHGVMTGVRIRVPYIFHAIISDLLFAGKFSVASVKKRVIFVLKQTLHHARNLGLFVFIYKSLCFLLRRYAHIQGGPDSLLAGFIGGAVAFGDTGGISGFVNKQLVLYLLARAVHGLTASAATHLAASSPAPSTSTSAVEKWLDPRNPNGFRIFAGLTLALTLTLTEYRSDLLSGSFMRTMTFLYHDSEKPTSVIPAKQWIPIMVSLAACVAGGAMHPELSLERLISYLV
eukprot:gb/GECH01002803.1/.p1 GENE.gb/GECH01002803.1/~~gb/GECH01002803.1/.p1  ORF type:complete len:252 (+),score=37.77 gb/GECH01002803.1/:1-756(+)